MKFLATLTLALTSAALSAAADLKTRQDDYDFCQNPPAGDMVYCTPLFGNTADCQIIAAELIQQRNSDGDSFTIEANGNVTMTHQSYTTSVINKQSTPQTFSRTHWSDAVQHICSDCSATYTGVDVQDDYCVEVASAESY